MKEVPLCCWHQWKKYLFAVDINETTYLFNVLSLWSIFLCLRHNLVSDAPISRVAPEMIQKREPVRKSIQWMVQLEDSSVKFASIFFQCCQMCGNVFVILSSSGANVVQNWWLPRLVKIFKVLLLHHFWTTWREHTICGCWHFVQAATTKFWSTF
jgi:hypothetical protein